MTTRGYINSFNRKNCSNCKYMYNNRGKVPSQETKDVYIKKTPHFQVFDGDVCDEHTYQGNGDSVISGNEELYETKIEVKSLGDFDIPYTEVIMVLKEKIDPEIIIKEFLDMEGIKSTQGIDCRDVRKITEDFIVFLKLKGFSKLNTYEVLFTY